MLFTIKWYLRVNYITYRIQVSCLHNVHLFIYTSWPILFKWFVLGSLKYEEIFKLKMSLTPCSSTHLSDMSLVHLRVRRFSNWKHMSLTPCSSIRSSVLNPQDFQVKNDCHWYLVHLYFLNGSSLNHHIDTILRNWRLKI